MVDYLSVRLPIFWEEVRRRTRAGRGFSVIAVYVSLLLMLLIGLHAVTPQLSRDFTVWPEFGKRLWLSLFFGQLIVMLMIAPGLAAGAVSAERERRTLEMLFLTPQRTVSIVIGKFLGALSQLLLVLLSGLPVVATVFFYGGVAPQEVLRGYLTILLVSFFYAALGFLASCVIARVTAATAWAYGFMLIHLIGLPLVLLLAFIFLMPDLDAGVLIHLAGPIEHLMSYLTAEEHGNGSYYWQGAISTLVQNIIVLGGCVLIIRGMRGNSPMRVGKATQADRPVAAETVRS